MDKKANKSIHQKLQKKKKGFTLIELLISSSIVMFLIMGAAQLTFHSISINRRSNYSLKSAELASSKLEYLKSLSFESDELNECSEREFLKGDSLHGSYQREWRIEDVSFEMKEIEIECFFESCPQKKIRVVLYLSRELGF